jgi:predicted nucleotidyltransferase
MDEQPFADDLREFLRLLTKHKVEHLLIGGYAVSLHGFPRNTGDMDVWVNPSVANAAAIRVALEEFGFATTAETLIALQTPGSILRMGYPPLRIELLTAPSGVAFDECLRRSELMQLGNHAVQTIGLDDLIVNKRAAGRPKDLIDALELERLRNQRRP